jgi:hypothetical protein
MGKYVLCQMSHKKDVKKRESFHIGLSPMNKVVQTASVVYLQYVAKSIATCKKKSLYNQPKPYFFTKLL